jgi:hypothetical protein
MSIWLELIKAEIFQKLSSECDTDARKLPLGYGVA